jgi:hypothetical protein
MEEFLEASNSLYCVRDLEFPIHFSVFTPACEALCTAFLTDTHTDTHTRL